MDHPDFDPSEAAFFDAGRAIESGLIPIVDEPPEQRRRWGKRTRALAAFCGVGILLGVWLLGSGGHRPEAIAAVAVADPAPAPAPAPPAGAVAASSRPVSRAPARHKSRHASSHRTRTAEPRVSRAGSWRRQCV
jgi:hypothetical protein